MAFRLLVLSAGFCYLEVYSSSWYWSYRDRNPGTMGTDMDRCIYGPVTRGTTLRQAGLQPQRGAEEAFSFYGTNAFTRLL